MLTNNEEIAARWKEYFSELLNVQENLVIIEAPIVGITINEDEDSVTLDEIRRALAQMKNGKSAGEDGIPAEILKAAGECGVRQLRKILNLAYKTETVPSEWQKRIIRPLFKKGEKAVCDNYRGVTLLTGKVYTRIIEA